MSNTPILDLYKQVLPARRRVSREGWVEFNCPACHDTKMRGGFMETADGGFRYHCFNGGCDYERPTGWGPEWGLMGRPLRLFELLGGNPSDIPVETIMKPTLAYDASGQRIGIEDRGSNEVYWNFPEVELPENAILLNKAKSHHAEEARKWLHDRGTFYERRHIFFWSPEYPRHVIVPFIHYGGKFVGWVGRRIDPGKHKNNHVRSTANPDHYMLNQHMITRRDMPRIYVVQGAFDAIAMRGLATFGSRLTLPMVNMLKASGKEIVLLSDYKGEEWKDYLSKAREHGFSMAVPEYRGWDNSQYSLKDPGDAIRRNGILTTFRDIGRSVTKDYDHAESMLRLYSSFNDER